ncbi:hypothetical protein HDA32_000242 [Spinactinospora alkalitolerans]|uniref:Integral membrane protein n=1 Tax=Spinactinospora alkalitolerans TaxID=687207 RepID=A0A852TQM5_9ACTN|nr:hypothetical protein [Spinactinospora alkalitolerans]NYE45122.1 hypothetical protein [Spinactinospora alkalitolerans]
MPDERVVELRIHGVSGGQAPELLEVGPATRVAGDELAGFFRRTTARDVESAPGVPREVFAWGNLTSGRSSRALWLLLLPFMLVNVAYWMRPRRLGGRLSRVHNAANHGYDMLVRLLALSLTALLTLAAAGIGMDLVGWQCAGYGSGCAELRPWLGVLSAPGAPLAEPGRALAAGSVLPMAVVAVLWRLSRRTGGEYEVTSSATAVHGSSAPLSSPLFWRNGEAVGRLRSAHVAVAASVIAALLLVPTLAHDRGAGTPVVGAVLTGLLTLTATLSVAGALTPDTDPRWNRWATGVCRVLRDASLALLAASLLHTVRPRPDWVAEGALPGYAIGLNGLFAAQCAIALALLATAAVLYRGSGTHAGTAMGGMAGPAVAAFGVLLGGVFSAALVYQAAGWLGGCYYPGAEETGCLTLSPPSAYSWLQLAFTLEAGIALLTAVALWLVARRRTRVRVAEVAAQYGRDADAPRTREIAWTRALGSMTEFLPACLSALLLPAVALVALVLYAVATGRLTAVPVDGAGAELSPAAMTADTTAWVQDAIDAMVTFGSWLGGLLLLALVWLGRSAYRSRPTRQAVGVLWDVGTFWPRAAHPLAPPCYAERAVPQLSARVSALVERGTGVVLSGHSQGSVLAAATVWQLPAGCGERLWLLTHGSPLYRLYARYFPAYFGPLALSELRGRVSGWCNLWRETDAVGGPVLLDEGVVERAEPLPDPRHYAHREGEAVRPEILGHSCYTEDPVYGTAVATAARGVTGAVDRDAPEIPRQARSAEDESLEG